MKKILVAIDNMKIYKEINKIEEYDIYKQDIVYKEGVLEYIAKNKVDIIITRDDLQGDMIKEIYIKQIKLLVPDVKLILFVKEMNNSYLEFLYNNNVFNIIQNHDTFTKEDIMNLIKEKNMENIIYDSKKSENRVINKTINITTKKRIAVFGTNGAGKSYISSVLSNIISNKLNMKTLLIDLDVQSSAIDIYNNLNCSNNLLMDIVKDVDNQTINNDTFQNNVYKKDKVDYITNNTSIFEYQNNLCIKHYDKIFELASQKYDVIISDIASNIFLDITYHNIKNADIIMFVISPNYISIRQAIKYLDLIINVWNIDKSKIYLVVNKITENSLSNMQIESLIPGYKIIMQVQYDNNLENVINGISSIDTDIVKEDKEIYRLFGIKKDCQLEKNQDIKKNKFLYNLFRKEEVT